MKELLLDFKRKFEQLKHSQTIAEELTKSDADLSEELLNWERPKDDQLKSSDDEKEKDTKQISLDMYLEGMDIEEIAEKRNMVAGTIYGHLIHFIGQDVEATDLLDEHILQEIIAVLEKHPDASSSEIRQLMDLKVDYPAIKVAQKHLEISKEQDANPHVI